MERSPLPESPLETPYRQQLIDALDDYRFRPGGAAHRFIEQRRLAIAVDEALPGFRDMVHDRVPTAGRVINCMVAYHDAPSEQNRRAVLVAYSAAEQLLSRNSLIDRELMSDREVYDRLVSDAGEEQPVIAVLRTMQRHRAVEPVPPSNIVSMAEYDKVVRRDRYEYASVLEQLTDGVNEALQEAMRDGEWDDSLLQAVEWLEYEHMIYLQRMDFDTQVDFYTSTLFQGMLRLYYMTHGCEYDDGVVTAICQELKGMPPYTAARKTAKLVTLISGEDMVRHRRRGEASRAEALWSGSVAGQLQQLVQPRQLTYAANKPRHSEWLQRMQYPSE